MGLFPASEAVGQIDAPRPLYDAIRNGTVVATFRGTGASSGPAVLVDLAKSARAGPGPLGVSIPPGSLLRAGNGSAQDMVVMAVLGRLTGVSGGTVSYVASPRIVVSITRPTTYVLAAFCAEFEKDNPSENDTFTLQQDRDPVLACIARESERLPVEAQQAAVWMYTDHMTFARMNSKFPLEHSVWVAAELVFRRCQPTDEKGRR
jgi:hypothetical protein